MFNNLLIKYYADDIPLNGVSVPGGKILSTTEDASGAQHENVVAEYLDPTGEPVQVSAANPLPVLASINTTGLATSANQVSEIAALNSLAAEDFATETTLALIKAKTDNLDITISALRDALRGVSSKTLTDLDTDLATLHTDLGTLLTQSDFDTKTGSLTETAPATDTASSGLNGRLQRIAQRLTSLIALLPTSLGAGGGLKIDGSGTSLPVTITGGGGGAVTIADGADTAEGAIADAIVAAGAAGTISAKLRRVTQGLEDLKTLLTTIDGGIPAALGQTTMANSMPVTIASDQSSLVVSVGAIDNTTLYSNTLAVTGAITGILTTGYQSIIFSFSGVWVGLLLIEGSEDNSTWEQKIVLDVNEFAMQDIINENGIFQIKSSSKYIRINVLQVSGTITALIVGRTVPGLNAADSIAFAMDKSFNMPLYVEETATKKDVSKALIPSDAPAPIYGFAQATSAVLFQVDTTGYQSVVVQTITAGSSITIQTSNDGIVWDNLLGYRGSVLTAPSASIANVGVYEYPALGRFVRGLMAGASFTNCLVYLRQRAANPFNLSTGAPINIAAINGTAPLSTGTNGVLGIAGAQTVGAAPVANPVSVGVIDTGGLTRRILSDTSGRIQNTNYVLDQTGTSRQLNVLSPAAGVQNVSSLPTQEISQFEGQSQIELLAQVLLELRILNQNISELPIALQSQNGTLDEPLKFRNDPSVFAN